MLQVEDAERDGELKSEESSLRTGKFTKMIDYGILACNNVQYYAFIACQNENTNARIVLAMYPPIHGIYKLLCKFVTCSDPT